MNNLIVKDVFSFAIISKNIDRGICFILGKVILKKIKASGLHFVDLPSKFQTIK